MNKDQDDRILPGKILKILKHGIEFKLADSEIYNTKEEWKDPCPLCKKRILKNEPTQNLTAKISKDPRLISIIKAHHFCIDPKSDYRNPYILVTTGTRENFFKELGSQLED